MKKIMYLRFIIIFFSLFTAIGCGSDKKGQPETLTEEFEKTIEENVILAKDYKGRLDEILTLEMASEISGFPASEAKKSPDSDLEKKINKISIQYSWDKTKRNRKMEILGRKMDVPVSDVISLSWLQNMTLKDFKRENHKPTDEELIAADKAVSEKTKEMQKEGKVTNDQADLATSMAKDAMKNIAFEEVKNVGDYAVFVDQKFAGVPTRELKVFYNGISFTLLVDLSDDSKANDDKAIALANKIINEKLK